MHTKNTQCSDVIFNKIKEWLIIKQPSLKDVPILMTSNFISDLNISEVDSFWLPNLFKYLQRHFNIKCALPSTLQNIITIEDIVKIVILCIKDKNTDTFFTTLYISDLPEEYLHISTEKIAEIMLNNPTKITALFGEQIGMFLGVRLSNKILRPVIFNVLCKLIAPIQLVLKLQKNTTQSSE